jgi:hypothetical protein
MLRNLVNLGGFILATVLIVPALLMILPFWGFSALTRAISGRLARRSVSWESIIEFEPEIGWKQKPNARSPLADKNGDRWIVQTDAEGWPEACRIEDSDIVVFGDSFAFGYGVDVRHAYYSQAHACLIKSVGSPGYNMVQALLWMRRYAHRLRGKMVVWFICTENDLAENLKPYTSKDYPTPFLRSANGAGKWEVVADHVRSTRSHEVDGGISNVTLFAYLCTPCAYSDRVYAAARHLIREAQALCQSQGAQLVIFSIPYKKQLSEQGLRELRRHLRSAEAFDPQYPERQLSRICGESDVPFIAGTDHLTIADYKPRDGHWNEHGNRKVAKVIEAYYSQASDKQRRQRVRVEERTALVAGA